MGSMGQVSAVYAQLPTLTPVPSATPNPVTITIWHDATDAEADLLTKWAADYQQIEPSVTVSIVAVADNLQSAVLDAIRKDQGPDLFLGRSGWAAGLATDRRIAPLNDRLDKSFRAQILPVAWSTVTIKDTVYGVPLDLQTTALYYNADLVKSDQLPRTAEDLLAQAPDMMFDFYTTAGLYFGAGGQLFDSSGALAVGTKADALVNYLTTLQTAYTAAEKAGGLSAGRIPVMNDRRFRDAKTPFLVASNLRMGDLQALLGAKLRVASLPPLTSGASWAPFVTSDCFYLNIYSRQSDAAVRFTRYVTGQVAQQGLGLLAGMIPVNASAPTLPNTIALQSQAQNGTPVPAAPQQGVLWGLMDTAVFGATVLKQPVSQVAQTTTQTLSALQNATAQPAP
jgi:arabinogalactan oligomer/maltooligosaccharide transport system substrate-binding protein